MEFWITPPHLPHSFANLRCILYRSLLILFFFYIQKFDFVLYSQFCNFILCTDGSWRCDRYLSFCEVWDQFLFLTFSIEVEELICKDCNKKYTGQTGHSFYTRFKEHFNDYKYKNGESNFAQHLIDNNHTFGPIEEVMNIVYITKKGKLMYTLERFHIYNETK